MPWLTHAPNTSPPDAEKQYWLVAACSSCPPAAHRNVPLLSAEFARSLPSAAVPPAKCLSANARSFPASVLYRSGKRTTLPASVRLQAGARCCECGRQGTDKPRRAILSEEACLFSGEGQAVHAA